MARTSYMCVLELAKGEFGDRVEREREREREAETTKEFYKLQPGLYRGVRANRRIAAFSGSPSL
jgi:hypothetical protein